MEVFTTLLSFVIKWIPRSISMDIICMHFWMKCVILMQKAMLLSCCKRLRHQNDILRSLRELRKQRTHDRLINMFVYAQNIRSSMFSRSMKARLGQNWRKFSMITSQAFDNFFQHARLRSGHERRSHIFNQLNDVENADRDLQDLKVASNPWSCCRLENFDRRLWSRYWSLAQDVNWFDID